MNINHRSVLSDLTLC